MLRRPWYGPGVYQPSHGRFVEPDPAALLGELAAVVSATLVTLSDGRLAATILPMLYDPGDGPLGALRGHLARANPQWRELDPGVGALAIFDGPEAYISPRHYPSTRATERHVPTWNYITVQAAGTLVIREDAAWLRSVVARLTDRHEAGAAQPWPIDAAPAAYLEGQLRAIIGVELHIERLDAKRKLSQNRDPADIAAVIAALAEGTPEERAVAAEMTRAMTSSTSANTSSTPDRPA